MKPHKWQKEIIAWANGAVIEYRMDGSDWSIDHDPDWYVEDEWEYRVKLEQKDD